MKNIRRLDGGDIDDLGPWRYVRITTDEGQQITLSDPKFRKSLGAEAVVGSHVSRSEIHIIHMGRIKKIVELRESKKYGDLIAVEIVQNGKGV